MPVAWKDYAIRLWGDDFIAPMSDVLGINRRTIERWNAGEGAPREGLQAELRRIALRSHARQVGTILRRMARGETLADIRADYRAHMVASTAVEHELGRYNAIAVLANRNEVEGEEGGED